MMPIYWIIWKADGFIEQCNKSRPTFYRESSQYPNKNTSFDRNSHPVITS